DRIDLAGVVGAAAGLLAAVEERVGGDHLGHGDACAQFLAQLAERTIGHPCHRGDEKVVTQGETGKLHGVMGKRKRGILPYRPCVCACWGGRATRWRREVSRRSSVVMWLRGRLARGILRVEGGVGRG